MANSVPMYDGTECKAANLPAGRGTKGRLAAGFLCDTFIKKISNLI